MVPPLQTCISIHRGGEGGGVITKSEMQSAMYKKYSLYTHKLLLKLIRSMKLLQIHCLLYYDHV